MKIFKISLSAICIFCCNFAVAASPWLPEPGSKQISVIQIFETYDRFFRGGENADVPDDIDQYTTTVSFTYGISDSLMLDARTGYTHTEFTPASRGDFEGRDDSRVGISWRVVDELIGGPYTPTVTFRFGLIWQGDYESSSPGNPHSPGDGASGVEGSILLGKIFESGWSIAGELGYRDRESPVPSEYFYNVSLYKWINRNISASLRYIENHALSGVNVGDPGITPSQFDELEEISRVIDFGFNYKISSRVTAGINYAKTIDGRNTGKEDIFAFNTGYSF